METLELLGVALGLASLAGINLYLTVFVTGLAVRFGWIALSPEYASLSVLGDPIILAISGFFFFVQFFADKIPWLDSAWDSVHTFIRPVGGACLAILVLGDANPVFEVVVGLLGGGTALATHSAKATSRLVVNTSPEPFSNIGSSFLEDGIVVGGLALLAWSPVVALVVLILAIATIGFFGTKLLRCARTRIGFAWKKLTEKADPRTGEMEMRIPVDVDCALHRKLEKEVRVSWVVPAVSSKLPGVPPDVSGHLFCLQDPSNSLFWAGKVWFRYKIVEIPAISGSKMAYDCGFLYDVLCIHDPAGTNKYRLFIDRPSRSLAKNSMTSWLEQNTRSQHQPEETSRTTAKETELTSVG